MADWVRLHRLPKRGVRFSASPRGAYIYKASRERWLKNQDGYNTEATIKVALSSGEIGRIENFRFIRSL